MNPARLVRIMTALRIDAPLGIAAPVWLAHLARTATLAPRDTPSLRVERDLSEPLSAAMHANHAHP